MCVYIGLYKGFVIKCKLGFRPKHECCVYLNPRMVALYRSTWSPGGVMTKEIYFSTWLVLVTAKVDVTSISNSLPVRNLSIM